MVVKEGKSSKEQAEEKRRGGKDAEGSALKRKEKEEKRREGLGNRGQKTRVMRRSG
jgi:hypothetical protein